MDSLQLAFGRPRSSACKICELSFSFLPFLWCWTPCFLLTMCTHTHINVIYIYIHTYTHNLAENEQPREGGSAGNKRSKCASSDHPPSQSFTYQVLSPPHSRVCCVLSLLVLSLRGHVHAHLSPPGDRSDETLTAAVCARLLAVPCRHAQQQSTSPRR
jgi:hypothetical protein